MHHSEGGLIGTKSLERLSPETQALLKRHFIFVGLGPASLTPNDYGLKVYNVYSEKDYVTKHFAHKQEPEKEYTIEFVSCKSPRKERTMYIADHAFNAVNLTTSPVDMVAFELPNLRPGKAPVGSYFHHTSPGYLFKLL